MIESGRRGTAAADRGQVLTEPRSDHQLGRAGHQGRQPEDVHHRRRVVQRAECRLWLATFDKVNLRAATVVDQRAGSVQRAADIVDDHSMRNAVLAEFEGRNAGALVARPGLVDPDMHVHALLVRKVYGRRRRAPVDRSQRPGIAVRQHIDRAAPFALRNFLEQRQAGAADAEADLDVLIANGRGVAANRLREVRVGRAFDQLQDALDCPAQVDGGRARFEQCSCGPRYLFPGELAVEGRKVKTPRGSSADQRRPAHVHVANGLDSVAPVAKVVHHEIMWQLALVDNLHDPGGAGLQPDRAKVVAGHSA